MNDKNRFSGIFAASATPFLPDESVNHDALSDLIRWNISQGVEGFFIGGSSAECFLLSPEERIKVFETAYEAASEECSRRGISLPMFAHVGAISVREACGYAKQAASIGYDAVAATPPFYYGFGSKAIADYYYAVADAFGKPLFIYNFPANTGKEFDIKDENIIALLQSGAIAGIKHTNLNVFQAERIKALNSELILLNGFDETFIAALALGADGAVGSTFNFMYPHFAKIRKAFEEKRLDDALKLQVKANNIMEALCSAGLIAAIKHVLCGFGIEAGLPRRPFLPMTADQKKAVDRAVSENLDN